VELVPRTNSLLGKETPLFISAELSCYQVAEDGERVRSSRKSTNFVDRRIDPDNDVVWIPDPRPHQTPLTIRH